MSDSIKVIFSSEAKYSNLDEWLHDLDETSMKMWLELLNKEELTELEFEIIAKKAIELYCLDMAIDNIPSDEEYIEKIIKEFTILFLLYHLQKLEYIKIYGKICFGINVPYETTHNGIQYFKSIS